ncbi:hypothetical protein CA13_41860 [Planctomycetes bacterium CA13]|uniref:Uncharacterized protein n=1 Tax=Novipirellula herctigrandis TaxID=2527986 RepID=A0A5C5Z875_9BACT|nr:hypothetical protein CA13_41860 [Planctomycetes bacterium CA13]
MVTHRMSQRDREIFQPWKITYAGVISNIFLADGCDDESAYAKSELTLPHKVTRHIARGSELQRVRALQREETG